MHKIKTLPPKEKKRKKGTQLDKICSRNLHPPLSLSSSHTLDNHHHHQKQSLAPSPEILGARFQKIFVAKATNTH